MSSRNGLSVLVVLAAVAILLLFSTGQASAQCSNMQQNRSQVQTTSQLTRASRPQLSTLQLTGLQSQVPTQAALQSAYLTQQYALQQAYLQQQYAYQQQQYAAMVAALQQQQQQNAMVAALLQQQQGNGLNQLNAR
jgi:hypothetical protein